jgi:hypothetical protein
VDDNRHLQLSGSCPEHVEPDIIDGYSLATMVDHSQPERLPDLQALCPSSDLVEE